ncbi:MAG: hypothetical protein NXI32_07430 [bacterium]|nr:hypothetical protein [bacterium]
MNYLAHAYRFLDDPYFTAGTAFPDWMSVLDRKNRARRQYAEPVTGDADPQIASFARGCVQHHHDDHWFHQNEDFVRLSTDFSLEVRQLLDTGLGHQAGFLGHISVELLLDAILMERIPSLLDAYYELLAGLNLDQLEMAANKICRKPVQNLPILVRRFLTERFLADYGDDGLLLYRLNGVMRRVRLPQLPAETAGWLATARPRVREVADGLLDPN